MNPSEGKRVHVTIRNHWSLKMCVCGGWSRSGGEGTRMAM